MELMAGKNAFWVAIAGDLKDSPSYSPVLHQDPRNAALYRQKQLQKKRKWVDVD